MIPAGSGGVACLADRIRDDLIPRAPDAYTAGDLSFLMHMLAAVAADYDRAVDVFVTEHDLLTALFSAARPHIEDAGLAARIDAALVAKVEGLRTPVLSARADIALRLLIDLHAAVETAEDAGAPWARDLNDKIWCFLDGYVERRAYDVPIG
jgi:hypothetical protein